MAQRVEHHHLVHAVDELGTEVLAHDLHHFGLHLRVVRLAGQLLDALRAEVRRHDDHGVAEVHRPALAVREAAVVEHLQQHVEHVRVRLLDLVEQDHGVRPAAHRFGEVAALLVTDVARRRADHPRHGVLLHELGHVDAHHGLLGVEEELGERLRQFGLAHARGTEEQERAVGTVGIGQAGARAANRIGHGPHGLVLAHYALRDRLLHAQELVALAFEHLRHGDAGPLGDHLGDLLVGDLVAHQGRDFRLGLLRGLDALLELRDLAVLQLGHARQVARAACGLEIQARPLQFFLDLRGALRRGLLGLPDLFEVGVLALERGKLLVERQQALLRSLVALLLERLALHLELHDAAVEPVEFLGLGVDLHADA